VWGKKETKTVGSKNEHPWKIPQIGVGKTKKGNLERVENMDVIEKSLTNSFGSRKNEKSRKRETTLK